MRTMDAFVGLLVCSAAASPPAIYAQTYPAKPVRVLVGYAPGGIADSSARIITQHLTNRLKANFFIDSRPGAGGRIAAEAGTKAAADGYALLFGTEGTHSVASVTVKNLAYDPIRDFTPIGLIGMHGFCLVVHPSLPVKSPQELIALARRHPGKLNYSSSGTGSGIHFAGELFKVAAKIDVPHVPYKGAAPALQDVIGGRIEMTLSPSPGPAIETGRVRLLGTTSSKRDPRFPDAPTLAEAGLTGFEAVGWTAIFGPPNLPSAIVAQLNSAMNSALVDADAVQRLRFWGSVASPREPAELEQLIRAEMTRYRKVVTEANLRFD